MAIHKLVLDDEFQEEYALLAIHCSEEAYKMAYSLNKRLGLQLKRTKSDVAIIKEERSAVFPIFQFENELQYTTYYLVGNKCKSQVNQINPPNGLFASETYEKTVMDYLLREFKNVDFFLKVESDFDQIPIWKSLALINEIKEVISAYEIDTSLIKANNNLIFN